jgi:hypothetical protein
MLFGLPPPACAILRLLYKTVLNADLNADLNTDLNTISKTVLKTDIAIPSWLFRLF